MIQSLRINKKPLLNYFELRNNFRPYELCEQAEVFADFAQVHCVPVKSILENKKDGKYAAEFFTKKYWYERLKAYTGKEDADFDYSDPFREAKEEAAGEFEDGAFKEKLEKILKCTQKIQPDGNTAFEDAKKAFILLAVCELSDIDARNIEDPLWKNENEADVSENINLLEYDWVYKHKRGEKVLYTRKEPYKFLYHDSDTLAGGSGIRNVLLIVRQGKSVVYNNAVIEVYSPVTGRPSDSMRLELKAGDFLHCRVSDGKIIEFQALKSEREGLCLERPSYGSSEIRISKNSTAAGSINNAQDISSFCAGSSSDGYLTVSGGRVCTLDYAPANNSQELKTRLTMYDDVVDIRITDDGKDYELLRSNGMVCTRGSGVKEGKVSLNR